MIAARPLSATAAALCLVASPACTKTKKESTVPVVDDDAEAAKAKAEADAKVAAEVRPAPTQAPSGPTLHVRGAVRELADVFTWIKLVTAAWTPESPFDVNAQGQALLLQLGYGPGMWANIDWNGVMAADLRLPPDGAPGDLRLFGTIAAKNPRAVIDAVPEGQRPQPLGGGLWELVTEGTRVFFREGSAALEVALEVGDLEKSQGLVAFGKSGWRAQVVADEFPPGFIDPREIVDLPPQSPLMKQVSGVVEELKELRVEADIGSQRDLLIRAAAVAPFSRLGLDTLGPVRRQSTALEAALPGGAAAVLAIPWGSPAALHAMLDKNVPVDQVPAPFDTLAREALGGVHTLADQIQGDVVIAVYLAPGDSLAVVMAGTVRDEAASRQALRAIHGAAVKGLQTFGEMAGGKDASFKIAVKSDGAAFAGGKADLITLGLPKNVEREADSIKFLLSKKKELEVIGGVSEGVAVLAFGGGARDVLGKAGRSTLASDVGLALARGASDGCHFCVGVDPVAALRLAAVVNRDTATDPAKAKELGKVAAELARVPSLGGVGLGLQVSADRGNLALGVPRTLMIPPPAVAKQLGGLVDQVTKPYFEGEDYDARERSR